VCDSAIIEIMLTPRRVHQPALRLSRAFWNSGQPSEENATSPPPASEDQKINSGYEPAEADDSQLPRSRQPQNLFEEKTDHMYKAAAGATVGLTGLATLGYEHIGLWCNLDAAGASLVLMGGAAVAASGIIPSSGDSGEPAKFKFKLLNDRANLRGERAALEELQTGASLRARLPAATSTLLSKHAKEEDDAFKVRVGAIQKDLQKEIEESLSEGLSVKRVMQKMQRRTFVLEFNDRAAGPGKLPGGTKQLVEQFAEAISLMIATASPYDEVVIKLTSPGGAVTDYGLASSQMLRLKRAGIATTVCVDTVAASGGYMMACVADKLVAAPFSFLGSIGVVAGMPNLHKVLKKNEVDYLLFTAGKFKRTVTALSEVTEEGKEKFQEQLEDIHTAFTAHVDTNRGEQLDIDKVGTGEAWLAAQGLELGLVDQLMTSDEYLRSQMVETDVISVTLKPKKKSFKDMFTKGIEETQAALSTALGSVGLLGNVASTIKFEDANSLHSVGTRYPHHGH